MYNRAEKGLQRRKGGKGMDEGGNVREGVWVAGGWGRERQRERTLPRRMIERGGEEAKLPQMK